MYGPASSELQSLLVITNSFDVTTDLLLERLAGEAVFRFNFDQFSRYQIRINASGVELSDEIGRSVSTQTICKAYWRKPFNARLEQAYPCAQYVEAEMRYALSELVNLLWLESKFVLVEPYAEKRTGKLVQLHIGQRFFKVPRYEFIVNRSAFRAAGVVKSLSNELVADGVLYTTRVETAHLAVKYPWFVEEEIQATKDVTVVFVRGQLFAFSLLRDFLDQSVDWRQVLTPDQRWCKYPLPGHLEMAIRDYMDALRLDYGRLDFLLDAAGCYWFCEVNVNGQFAWLDLEDKEGLLACIAAEISPSTSRHPLRKAHPLVETL